MCRQTYFQKEDIKGGWVGGGGGSVYLTQKAPVNHRLTRSAGLRCALSSLSPSDGTGDTLFVPGRRVAPA